MLGMKLQARRRLGDGLKGRLNRVLLPMGGQPPGGICH